MGRPFRTQAVATTHIDDPASVARANLSRILMQARMEGGENIQSTHLAEALQYRPNGMME